MKQKPDLVPLHSSGTSKGQNIPSVIFGTVKITAKIISAIIPTRLYPLGKRSLTKPLQDFSSSRNMQNGLKMQKIA
jgi:hypothetical protein